MNIVSAKYNKSASSLTNDCITIDPGMPLPGGGKRMVCVPIAEDNTE